MSIVDSHSQIWVLRTNEKTNRQTNRLTMLVVKSLLRLLMDDLRSVLLETPGRLEDDKVGAGDIGLVLTLATLYLQYQCHVTVWANLDMIYVDPC